MSIMSVNEFEEIIRFRAILRNLEGKSLRNSDSLVQSGAQFEMVESTPNKGTHFESATAN